MTRLLRLLDRLTVERIITGYTLEPVPHYLRARRPVLSYGMYALDRAGRSNLKRFLEDMAGLGAQLSYHRTLGSTACACGGVRRTDQLTAVAWFDHHHPLRRAVRLVSRRYQAGSREALPGSWHYPDARICGIDDELRDTIPALAHQMWLRGRYVVVLSQSPSPPLPGMRSQAVRLLKPWARYLQASVRP